MIEDSEYGRNGQEELKNQSIDFQIDEASNGDLAVKMYQKSLMKECKQKDC